MREKLGERDLPEEVVVRNYVLNDHITGLPRICVTVGARDGVACRGLAICSLSEAQIEVGFVENYGFKKSRRRMLRAMNSGLNDQPIKREEAWKVIKTTALYKRYKIQSKEFFSYKSAYDVELTVDEEKSIK